jgi:hypothetical protein
MTLKRPVTFLSIGKGQSRRDILIGKSIRFPSQALKLSGAGPAATLNEEGYVIVANADRVIVAGNTATERSMAYRPSNSWCAATVRLRSSGGQDRRLAHDALARHLGRY